ncbi:alpha/beta hydrolase [Pseudoruegeria sp. SK021]|uniref:alpha/beta hydrolase n=1 Tax=Pseudoruegeria sp. SK021 TaxID=1933035 RepID=UPI000A21B795|nr:alpha/beta hydrolase [Pseudoruegeria sp. SK021]OSP56683.1 hypothetical protein BV911_01640 [Pseudoruegeria sp. SK021]
MALLALNVTDDGIIPRAGGALIPALQVSLTDLPKGAPIVILIHGFRFSPSVPSDDPHEHILSATPTIDCWKALSWPTALGLTGPNAAPGLAISLGWPSLGSIWRAYGAAERTGRALAGLIGVLRRSHSGPITVLTHSLGARVALQALPVLSADTAIDRIVMLAAAEVQSACRHALDSPAGRKVEVVNVTSRENDLFDFLLERALGTMPLKTLGNGLPKAGPRWLDLPLDNSITLSRLASLGYSVPPPDRRVCHWSLYLRPGTFDLYRDMLIRPTETPLSRMRIEASHRIAPRWSRLFALPRPAAAAGLVEGAT